MSTLAATCALTGTPIFEGDPVVAVRVDRQKFMERARVGVPFGRDLADFAAVREVIRTTYAGYGLPEDRSADEEGDAGDWIFFQRFAWDGALEEEPEPSAGERKQLKQAAELPVRGLQFYSVVQFALRVRRDVRSALFFPVSEVDSCDVYAYRVLAEEIDRYRPRQPIG